MAASFQTGWSALLANINGALAASPSLAAPSANCCINRLREGCRSKVFIDCPLVFDDINFNGVSAKKNDAIHSITIKALYFVNFIASSICANTAYCKGFRALTELGLWFDVRPWH